MKTPLTSIQSVLVIWPTRSDLGAIRARLGLVGRALRKERCHAKFLEGHLNELRPLICLGQ